MKPQNLFNFIFIIFIALISLRAVNAQVSVRIPDTDIRVSSIEKVGGEVWVGTDKGAYRVVGEASQLVSTEGLAVSEIVNLEGETWLLTDNGTYRVEAENLRLMLDKSLTVKKILKNGDDVWLWTEASHTTNPLFGSVYRIRAGVVRRMTDESLKVTSMQLLGGQIWILTGNLLDPSHAYRVERDKVQIVGSSDLNVSEVKEIGGYPWLATNKGAYRVDGNEIRRVTDEELEVADVEEVNGQVWLATNKGIYRLEGKTAYRINKEELRVSKIHNVNGQVWFEAGTNPRSDSSSVGFGYDLLFFIKDGTLHQASDEGFSINNIKTGGDHFWLLADQGVYVKRGEKVERITDRNLTVWGIEIIQGKVWLATDQGAYILEEGGEARRVTSRNIRISNIKEINGKVWMATDRGAFRYDEEVSLKISYRSADTWWKSLFSWVIPGNVLVSGSVQPLIRYARNSDGEDPYGNTFPRRFEIIMETDGGKFKDAVETGKYSSADNFERSLEWGRPLIYAVVLDQWGNKEVFQTRAIVIPGPLALAIQTSFLGLAALLLTIFFAGYNDTVLRWIQNPWLRKLKFLNFIPALLTNLPFVKTHLMRRYLRNIKKDNTFARWRDQFVVPSEGLLPDKFHERLKKQGKIFLTGKSGVGKTTALEFLTFQFALIGKPIYSWSLPVPVLIRLSFYEREMDLESMFSDELENWGQLIDKEINLWFLRKGGFLIFIDGLNEVDEAARGKVRKFILKYQKNNYFCVSSQISYSEFEDLEQIPLPGLSREQVEGLLRQQLGKECADSISAQFTDELYSIYRLPQNLEFAIRVLHDNQPLPQSQPELYKAVLSPILDSWEQEVQSDYTYSLYKRTYEMLRARASHFDDPESLVPIEVVGHLVKEKLLIRRGHYHYFQHHSVRDYLASKHFAHQWGALLNTEVLIDNNWRQMLEFSIVEIGNSEVAGSILYSLVDKNKNLSRELYKSLRVSHPDLCLGWSSRFERKYAQAELSEGSRSDRS
jgi:hypothetical protein